MLPDCSREYQLKKILGGACPQTPLSSSRLRRSIGKIQFFAAKPNPMPVWYIKATRDNNSTTYYQS